MAAAGSVSRPLRGGSPVPSRPVPPDPAAPFLGLRRSRLQVRSRLLAARSRAGRAAPPPRGSEQGLPAGLGGSPRHLRGRSASVPADTSANAVRGEQPRSAAGRPGARPRPLGAPAGRSLAAVPHGRVSPAPPPRRLPRGIT